MRGCSCMLGWRWWDLENVTVVALWSSECTFCSSYVYIRIAQRWLLLPESEG
jgi:hypothetical protein